MKNAEKKVSVREVKPRIKSKTLWFNGLALTLGVLESKMGVLAPLLGAQVGPVLMIAVPLVNMALREFTSQAIGKK